MSSGTSSVAVSGSQPEVPPVGSSSESLTQLLARILNQLSISAWLPSAAIVFIALLYGNLRGHQGDPIQALQTISSMGWGSLILAIGAVVLVTMLTQAFGFDAIRLLEGYWGGGSIAGWFAEFGCRWQRWRRQRLERSLTTAKQVGFDHARRVMLSDEHLRRFVPILEADVYGQNPLKPPISASQSEVNLARETGWYGEARPGDVRRIEELTLRITEDYPDEIYRILPTRLGNVLRASESRIDVQGSGALEGSVHRVFHLLPSTLQSEHDQFRSRLDLYCTLVLVFAGAAVGALPAMDWSRSAEIAAVISLALALISYRAAIASARAYATVLETIASFVEGHQDDDSR